MGLADWERILDVNVRGVVHGIHAAYPVMVRQRSGHIVNTGSMAGYAPAPGTTAYSMTKYAVMGLSLALRVEAAPLGVKVTVACPGYIDTGIFRTARLVGYDLDTLVEAIRVKAMPPDVCARVMLRGVARNEPIVLISGYARFAWWASRLFPRLTLRLASRLARPLLAPPDVRGAAAAPPSSGRAGGTD
jgi:short-subunit dehydrogenase